MSIFGKKGRNQFLRNQPNKLQQESEQNSNATTGAGYAGLFSSASTVKPKQEVTSKQRTLPETGARTAMTDRPIANLHSATASTTTTTITKSTSSSLTQSASASTSDAQAASSTHVATSATKSQEADKPVTTKPKQNEQKSGDVSNPPTQAEATNITANSAKIDNAKNTLKQAISTYNEARRTLQTNMFAKRADLQAALTQNKLTLAQTQRDIKAMQKRMAQNDGSELVPVQKTISDLQNQANKIAIQLKSKQGTLDDLNRQRRSLEKQAQMVLEQGKKFKQDEEEIMSAFSGLKDPEKVLAFADAHRKQIDDIKAGEKKLTATQISLKKQLEDNINEINQAKDEIAKINSDQNANGQAITNAQRKLDTMKAKVANDRADDKAQLDKLEHQQADLTDESKRLYDQLHTLSDGITAWLNFSEPVHTLSEADYAPLILDIDSFSAHDSDALAPLSDMLQSMPKKQVGIFTTYFNIDLVPTIDAWSMANNFNPDEVQIINCLYQLQNAGEGTENAATLPANIQNRQWNATHTAETITMPDGQTNMLVTYQLDAQKKPTKLIAKIAYRQGDKVTKESFFRKNGVLSANTFYDAANDITRKEFYRRDGLLVVSATYQGQKLRDISVFNETGLQINSFDSLTALNVWWLQKSFPQEGAMIGNFKSKAYRDLTAKSDVKLVPFVDEAVVDTDDFTRWMAERKQQAFITNNVNTQSALAQKAKLPLYVNVLNQAPLPVQLSMPVDY
ncbi:hypothetical protein ACPD8N_05120 [Lacticaseibacillus chiayiensis]|uniref:hypothetical protein n=1 Tax=Lacticaseibacillus chiayiensis TaxID=2100821 RepID=UPI003C71F551